MRVLIGWPLIAKAVFMLTQEKPKRLQSLFAARGNYVHCLLFEIEERPDWHTLIFSRPK
jgi:hypothetical protein